MYLDEIYALPDLIYIDEDDWNVVIVECSFLASKWAQVGAYLGVSISTIDQIKYTSPGDSQQCLNEVLKAWISQNYNVMRFGTPSWKRLLRAISRVDFAFSKHLAAKHQGTFRKDIGYIHD